LLNAKRKIRIAKGRGTTVQDVNKLLKMHQEMATAMKKIRKMGGLKGSARCSARAVPAAAWAVSAMAADGRAGADGRRGCPGLAAAGLPPGFENFGRKSKLTSILEINRRNNRWQSIRLSRGGSKKRPYYKIVVADARSAARRQLHREDRHLQPAARQGFDEKRIKLDADRAKHWLSVGAQPTDRVARFLDAAGVKERAARNNPNKAQAGREGHRARRGACREAAAEAAAAPAPAPVEGLCLKRLPSSRRRVARSRERPKPTRAEAVA
jgi:small subunit ribosomal protein S16